MKIRSAVLASLLGLALALLSTPGSGLASSEPVATAVVQDHQVAFEPAAPYSSITLAVSGPGGFYAHTVFPYPEHPVFPQSLSDQELGDGLYTFELRLIPPQQVASNDRTSEPVLSSADMPHSAERRLGGSNHPLVQTGSFRIRSGSIVVVTPQSQEAMEKDILQLDDVIVAGSLCVGVRCENGEGFGDDTLRLKEDNLRLKLYDSSDPAGTFPTNDWQITINDNVDGGIERFSIMDVDGGATPFTIRAGAPESSLYVSASGDIGLGTAAPARRVHAVGGDAPSIRLEQDASGGNAAQTWDITGDDANLSITDVTGGSTSPFRVLPGAPSNTLVVSSGGVGVGTGSPLAPLHLEATDGLPTDLMILRNNGPTRFLLDNTTTSSQWRFNSANTGNLRIADGDTNIELELEPDGDLYITGSLTTNSGYYPDYVFSDGYSLMPLDFLESFISECGHLPNIPPAEATQGGRKVNMSELQLRLLEKVEELTLYTLDQEHKIQQQDETITQLLQTIEGLNRRVGDLEGGQR